MIKKTIWVSIIIAIFTIGIYFKNMSHINYLKEVKTYFDYENKEIHTIIYKEKKENWGSLEGRIITDNTITYKYPDLLKIECNGNIKTVEIYNKNEYFYYNEGENKIKKKECFPIDSPYITEIETKMNQIIEKGDYEFFGYEELGNMQLKVIGMKSLYDNHKYMHKIWIGEINGISLPFREEYFADNVVVSKSSYTYFNVNEYIDNSVFNKSSFPNIETINAGIIPKYLNEYNDAKSFLKFKLKLPNKLPEGYLPLEIAVIPPVDNPKFYCIYYDFKGKRIYLNESINETQLNCNALINNIPCEIRISDKNVLLQWKQDNVYISVGSDIDEYEDVVILSCSIAGGRLEKK